MYIYIYSKINEIWEELDGGVKRKMKRVEEEEEEEWKANETKLDGLWTDEKRIYRERGKREGEGEGGEDGREGWRDGEEARRRREIGSLIKEAQGRIDCSGSIPRLHFHRDNDRSSRIYSLLLLLSPLFHPLRPFSDPLKR